MHKIRSILAASLLFTVSSSAFADATLSPYISTIEENARLIAQFSSLSEKQIRSSTAEADEESFQEFYDTVFSDEYTLEDFQADAHTMLDDLSAALPFFRAERSSNDIIDLREALDTLNDAEALARWNQKFTSLKDTLIPLMPIAPVSVLKQDLASLLDRLEEYLGEVEQMELALGVPVTQIDDLRTALDDIRTEEEVQKFLQTLEDTLGTLSPTSDSLSS